MFITYLELFSLILLNIHINGILQRENPVLPNAIFFSIRTVLRSTPIGEISFKTPSPFIRIRIRRFHQSQSTCRIISPLSILIGGDRKILSRRIVLIQWFASINFTRTMIRSLLWHHSQKQLYWTFKLFLEPKIANSFFP